ncbi:MAG TPA: TetR/AcrR family transcriptional regulator [Acidobacteriaceae bacterium]|nr:TetR/AcrR family transcriptional regulator [Acidobacteriaceae bacterium]
MSKRVEKDRRSVKRLRPRQIEAVIISTVFDELLEKGFRAVTIESISAKTGIAKTSIYRRWPNKAAMVMEAFLFRIGPGIEFPSKSSYVESIRFQMLALAKAFRGPFGSMIKALLGEAQFDLELAEAFRTRWIGPRREAAKEVIQSAIRNKEIRPDVDLDQALDALYGWLYYRLMIGSGPLSDACVRGIFSAVLDGLRVRQD